MAPPVTPAASAPFTCRPNLRGVFGMVTAGHYLAAMAGHAMLERGGTAVDAAAAAGFASSVVEPHLCGLGGEAPLLVYEPGGGGGAGTMHAVSGQGVAPAAATIDSFRAAGLGIVPGNGLLPATTPAIFDTLSLALLRWGRLRLADVLAPAREWAADGFPMYRSLRDFLASLGAASFDDWPATRAVFFPAGEPVAVGTLLAQPDLARTLDRLIQAEARAGGSREAGIEAARREFATGFVAREIDRFARETAAGDATGVARRGLLRAEDMAAWRARVETPVSAPFGGGVVFKCGPWTQGPVFLQQLALLAGFDLRAMGHNSADYVHTVIECAKLAFADREFEYGDPDFTSVDLGRLLSAEYAASRRALVDPQAASQVLRPGRGPHARVTQAPGTSLGAATARATSEPSALSGDTTHVDAADRFGALVSLTPSGGWLQSSPRIPALGFALGTRGQMFSLDPAHPNALAPGKRPRATLTPSLARMADGTIVAFGTPGGDQQDQWTLQCFLNMAVFGMPPQEAVEAPTFHTTHFPSSFYPRRAEPGKVVVEARVPAAVLDVLAARGHLVERAGPWANGRVLAIARDPRSGVLTAAASPRKETAYAVGR
ncbi:MAG: gamma-glutamyltransferase [Planctomycetes bacterium]|nr:gamma-glutamyltransferase [Planctomycetota bacterium]